MDVYIISKAGTCKSLNPELKYIYKSQHGTQLWNYVANFENFFIWATTSNRFCFTINHMNKAVLGVGAAFYLLGSKTSSAIIPCYFIFCHCWQALSNVPWFVLFSCFLLISCFASIFNNIAFLICTSVSRWNMENHFDWLHHQSLIQLQFF